MPQQQLQLLAADVERLLAAGAATAVGDEGLGRRARALREHAKKIPVLNPIADAVERVTGSPPKKASPALLDLLLIVRQIRMNLAGYSPTDPLNPMEPGGPWSSPLPVADVYSFLDSLPGSKNSRPSELVEEGRQRPAVDLRLAGPLLGALDQNWPVPYDRDPLYEPLLTPFGPALRPELEGSLNLQGNLYDARRLDLLARIDNPRGVERCRAALASGSVPLKIQSLHTLSRVAPEEAERAAFAVLERTNVYKDLKDAALTALGAAASDRALETLLAAYDEAGQEGGGAAEGLASSRHPAVVERLLDRLGNLVGEMNTRRKALDQARKARGRTLTALEKDQEALEKVRSRLLQLLNVLVRRGDRPSIQAALDLLRHRTPDVKRLAHQALYGLGPSAAPALPELLPLVQAREIHLRTSVIEALARVGPAAGPPAVPVLVTALRQDASANVRAAAAYALGHLRPDPAAVVPALTAPLQEKAEAVRAQAAAALGTLGPAAAEALPALKELLASKKGSWWSRRNVEQAIADIEGRTRKPTG